MNKVKVTSVKLILSHEIRQALVDTIKTSLGQNAQKFCGVGFIPLENNMINSWMLSQFGNTAIVLIPITEGIASVRRMITEGEMTIHKSDALCLGFINIDGSVTSNSTNSNLSVGWRDACYNLSVGWRDACYKNNPPVKWDIKNSNPLDYISYRTGMVRDSP